MGVPGPEAKTVGSKAVSDERNKLLKLLKPDPRQSPTASTGTRGTNDAGLSDWAGCGGATNVLAQQATEQPLDLVLCQWLKFGCRYLRVPQTLLLAANADSKVLARLRTEEGNPASEDIKCIEGLNLRKRTLRFIDLSQSRLYAADFMTDDLRGAALWQASLKGANLKLAQLQGANLAQAQLQGADLFNTPAAGREPHLGPAAGRGPERCPAAGRGPSRCQSFADFVWKS
jgi:Pentapeptide repeats (8 copies)